MPDYISDSRELREKCKANIWPKSLLAKYHPREDYDGDTKTAFTQLIYQSPSLEFIIAGASNDATIDNFLEVFNYPFHTFPYELMTSSAHMLQIRRGFTTPVDNLQMAELSKQVNDGVMAGVKKALSEKERSRNPRPSWLSQEDYEGRYDSPSVFSTAVASGIARIRAEFDVDSNMLFDTAYLFAMIPAMYGKCHIDACLHGLHLAGFLSKDYSKQLI